MVRNPPAARLTSNWDSTCGEKPHSHEGTSWWGSDTECKTQTKIAQSNALISEAKTQVATDPTLALRLAEQAMLIYNADVIEKGALKIYKENSFYKIVTK